MKRIVVCVAGLLAVSAAHAANMSVDEYEGNSPYVINGTSETWDTVWIADQPGYNGEMTITNGGALNLYHIDVGNDPGAGQTADLFVIDSTVTTTEDLRIGDRSGTSTLTVSGNSLIDVGDDLWMNSGGNTTSILNMNGGLLKTGWLQFYDVTTGSSTINLSGGRMQLGELRRIGYDNATVVFTGGELLVSTNTMTVAQMNGYIASGDIDVSGAPSYSVTTMNVDGTEYTTLAIPEPATLGLLGFVGAGFLVVRRRRMM